MNWDIDSNILFNYNKYLKKIIIIHISLNSLYIKI